MFFLLSIRLVSISEQVEVVHAVHYSIVTVTTVCLFQSACHRTLVLLYLCYAMSVSFSKCMKSIICSVATGIGKCSTKMSQSDCSYQSGNQRTCSLHIHSFLETGTDNVFINWTCSNFSMQQTLAIICALCGPQISACSSTHRLYWWCTTSTVTTIDHQSCLPLKGSSDD